MKDSVQPLESITTPRPRDYTRSRAVCGEALVTAIQFLTRIPLTAAAPTPDALRRAPLFFPLVGTMVGGFTAAVLWLAGLLWPVWLAVIVALAAEVRLTGALHEDGLADFCDGMGGGWNRAKVLEIFQDSRIGTYGVLALCFAVALRVGSLVVLLGEGDQERWLIGSAALIASAAAGRWVIVLAMVIVPPLTRLESLSRDIGSRMTWGSFASSGLGALPAITLFAYLMPIQALLALGLIAAALLMLLPLIQRKLGGTTGDCLGCIGYVSQVLLLFAAAARI